MSDLNWAAANWAAQTGSLTLRERYGDLSFEANVLISFVLLQVSSHMCSCHAVQVYSCSLETAALVACQQQVSAG